VAFVIHNLFLHRKNGIAGRFTFLIVPEKTVPKTCGLKYLYRFYKIILNLLLIINKNYLFLPVLFAGCVFSLFDQLKKALHLGFWSGTGNFFKYILRQVIFQVRHYVKVFPPTIDYFPAGQAVVTTCSAVLKCYRSAQSGTSPFKVIFHFYERLFNNCGLG
jgi:hypothetical protein